MSKAVLILDEMPRNCRECPLHEMSGSFNKAICVPMNKLYDKFAEHRQDWCPLKEQ